MDFHPKNQKLISRQYLDFVKIDSNTITYEGIWFYSRRYDIQDWLNGLITRLPGWMSCSCRLENPVVDVLVGDPGRKWESGLSYLISDSTHYWVKVKDLNNGHFVYFPRDASRGNVAARIGSFMHSSSGNILTAWMSYSWSNGLSVQWPTWHMMMLLSSC